MKFKFKTDVGVTYTSEPDYDLKEGYINPNQLLKDSEQAQQVNDAVRLIEQFLSQAEQAGVVEFT